MWRPGIPRMKSSTILWPFLCGRPTFGPRQSKSTDRNLFCPHTQFSKLFRFGDSRCGYSDISSGLSSGNGDFLYDRKFFFPVQHTIFPWGSLWWRTRGATGHVWTHLQPSAWCGVAAKRAQCFTGSMNKSVS